MKIIVKKEGKLLEYLSENLDMPRKRIKQYLTHGAIYIDNDRVYQFDYKIVPGMNILIDTESKNKTTFPFEIIFEDENILVVNKPSGLLTIATDKEKERTLYHIVREYLVSKDKTSRVFIVHRLDKDTSGIVIFAKNEKIKNALQENWNEYVKLREYIGIVHGNLDKKEDRVVQYLKETKTNLVYVDRKKDGVEAITNYQVQKENEKYSLLKIIIETGRKNQIRVCFSSMNHPLVGDKKYGIKDNSKRMFLHANRLKIYYPKIKKEILFETKTPIEFKKLMNI